MFGGHRYYLGFYPSAVIYTFTVGLYFFGWILDLVRLRSLVDKANQSTANKSSIKLNNLLAEQLIKSNNSTQTIPSPSANLNPYDELEKLASLKERGIITEDEFQTKKKKLLG
jgi:hypothetical protein